MPETIGVTWKDNAQPRPEHTLTAEYRGLKLTVTLSAGGYLYACVTGSFVGFSVSATVPGTSLGQTMAEAQSLTIATADKLASAGWIAR